MLRPRDEQGYPVHWLDVIPEWPKPKPKPKYPLHDLVKLWQEAKKRQEEADWHAEHWHQAYDSLKQEYLASKDRDLCLCCQRVKDGTEEGETVELCHECSTGRETRKSLELEGVLRNLIERTGQEKIKKPCWNSPCLPCLLQETFHTSPPPPF